jgi:hypothetical protein
MTRLLAISLILAAVPAAAQIPSTPSAAAEVIAGYAGFVDDVFVDHTAVGGSARIYLSPRISVGPEIVYMKGPRDDRDLFVTGNLTFDLIAATDGRPVVPFLVIGGGYFRHSDRFGGTTFSSGEGAVTGGGGARVRLTDRLFALGEFRLGWEPHYRITGGVGVNW